jgi:hypothetical protein|tara:strand:+ start:659 stop:1033 length:375 start_codon:yes stop_codon:yes gene_type:complete
MPLPILPVLGAVAKFIAANGVRKAAIKHGPKVIDKAQKQIKARQKAITKRVEQKRAKGEIPARDKSPLQTQKSRETRLTNERNKRIPNRVKDGEFPVDEVPLKFSTGGLVSARLSKAGPNAKPL